MAGLQVTPEGAKLRPKVVIVTPQRHLHESHFKLPDHLRASIPSEVYTVVVADCHYEAFGSYGSAGKAMLEHCDVRAFDTLTRSMIASHSFIADSPPMYSSHDVSIPVGLVDIVAWVDFLPVQR